MCRDPAAHPCCGRKSLLRSDATSKLRRAPSCRYITTLLASDNMPPLKNAVLSASMLRCNARRLHRTFASQSKYRFNASSSEHQEQQQAEKKAGPKYVCSPLPELSIYHTNIYLCNRDVQREFYSTFSRPVAITAMVALLTYQIAYWAWMKLESIGQKESKQGVSILSLSYITYASCRLRDGKLTDPFCPLFSFSS